MDRNRKITSRRTFRIEIMCAFRKVLRWLVKSRHRDLSIVIQPLTDFPIEIEDSIDFEYQFFQVIRAIFFSSAYLFTLLAGSELSGLLFFLLLVPIVFVLTIQSYRTTSKTYPALPFTSSIKIKHLCRRLTCHTNTKSRHLAKTRCVLS